MLDTDQNAFSSNHSMNKWESWGVLLFADGEVYVSNTFLTTWNLVVQLPLVFKLQLYHFCTTSDNSRGVNKHLHL